MSRNVVLWFSFWDLDSKDVMKRNAALLCILVLIYDNLRTRSRIRVHAQVFHNTAKNFYIFPYYYEVYVGVNVEISYIFFPVIPLHIYILYVIWMWDLEMFMQEILSNITLDNKNVDQDLINHVLIRVIISF